jgi:hypothetical protein
VERPHTPGQIAELDLNLEIEYLERGLRAYLENLRAQTTAGKRSGPYKNLDAYTLREANVFFGREDAINDLLEIMGQAPLTILQAESGAGKTSLLQAGILPRVIDESHLAILIRPQFQNPSQAIKRCFLEDLQLTPKLAHMPLLNFMRRVIKAIGANTTLYMILDQFEEFFAERTSEPDQQDFIRDLAECLNDATLNVRWVISITSDTFGKLGKFDPYIRNPFSNVYSLFLFDRQKAAEVIEKTAGAYGLSFEEGLLERIIHDLGNQRDDPIAPTQMQLVCAALYEDIKDRSTCFTHELYDQKGHVQTILHDYIGSVLNHKLPSSERAAAMKILEELVTSRKQRVMRASTDLEAVLRKKGIPADTVQSTLEHLVNQRLLRRLGDDPYQMQYEIVHDYLLKEIEINDAVRNVKEVEELLEEGVKNWNRQAILLAPSVLAIVKSAGDDIFISTPAAILLFRSAIEYNQPSGQWADLIPAAQSKQLIASYLQKKSTAKTREALWSLRAHLTWPQKVRVALVRFIYAMGLSFRKVAVLASIVTASYLVGLIVINVAQRFVPWAPVTSFNELCLGGGESSHPPVAMDALDNSHLVAYDPRSQILCETRNFGVTWQQANTDLPLGLTVHAIAVHSTVYLATEQGVYYRTKDSWKKLPGFPDGTPAFTHIVVSSDGQQIHVSTDQEALYTYDLARSAWQPMNDDGITGEITDLAINYEYLAISTTDGIWYRRLDPDARWTQYPPVSTGITSIEMRYTVQSWKHTIINRLEDDAFVFTTEKGEIYAGLLTEHYIEPTRVASISASLSSLAVSGYTVCVTAPDGLNCQQQWSMLDPEWWRIPRSNRE